MISFCPASEGNRGCRSGLRLPVSLPALLGSQAGSCSQALPRLLPTSVLCSWHVHQSGFQLLVPWTQHLSAPVKPPLPVVKHCLLPADPFHWRRRRPAFWALGILGPHLGTSLQGSVSYQCLRAQGTKPAASSTFPLGAWGLADGDRSSPCCRSRTLLPLCSVSIL